MKFILLSCVRGSTSLIDLISSACKDHPTAKFILIGELLNAFPLCEQDVKNSIASELFPEELVEANLKKLAKAKYNPKEVGKTSLSDHFNAMCTPQGNKWRLTKEKALHRYFDFLHSLESALPESKQVYLVPGNVEYPGELFVVLSKLNSVINLDQDAIAQDGVTISGVGGAPAGLDLGGLQSQAMRAPYEYHEDEFARRLNLLWGVDVLITNVAPEQSPALSTFVKKSPVQLVICSARNDLKGMREGGSELQDLDGKCIIKVQAFNAEKNTGYVVDLVPNKLSSVNLEVDIWTWIPNETAKSREKSTTEQQGAQQPAPAKYSTLEDCIRNREARARRKSIDLDNSEIYQRNSQYGKGKHRKKLCSKLRLYKKFSAINTVRERTRKTDRSQ